MAIKKTDNPEPETKTKEGLSIEQQNDLLDKMNKMSEKMELLEKNNGNNKGGQDLIDALKAFKEGGGDSRSYDTPDSSGYLDPDQIDPNDVLEGDSVVRFYAYKSNYVIVDDKRQGRSIQTPFKNTIMFEHVGAKTTGIGKHKETEHSCVYNCKSKKEAEWLKSHTLYQVTFYASGGDGHIMSVSSKKATRMAALMTSLKMQDRYSIINMCRQHDIEMTEDANEMRIALANKLSEEIDLKEQAVDEQRVKEMLFTKKDIAELN